MKAHDLIRQHAARLEFQSALLLILEELESQQMLTDQIAALTKSNIDLAAANVFLATALESIKTALGADNPDLATIITNAQANAMVLQNNQATAQAIVGTLMPAPPAA